MSAAAGFPAKVPRNPERPGKDSARTPILMVTSLHDTMDCRVDDASGSEWGPVDRFIDEPVQPRELVARIREALSKQVS